MGYCIGILGATGAVGRELLKILEERSFPVSHLRLFASERSRGLTLLFRNQPVEVQTVEENSFQGLDFLFSSVEADLTRRYVPQALQSGSTVIDDSSVFRLQEGIPLVIPEINGSLLNRVSKLYPTPNCAVAVIALGLAPVLRAFGVSQLVTTTFQAVSGAGYRQVERLREQSLSFLNSGIMEESPPGKDHLAFNVIPSISPVKAVDSLSPKQPVFLDQDTLEEEKIKKELPKIFNRFFEVVCTAVRVPTIRGHSASCFVETERDINLVQLENSFRRQEGLTVLPVSRSFSALDGVGKDSIFLYRLRWNPAQPREISFFVSGDNLRKGAALNMVQIAEGLTRLRPPAGKP